MWIHVTSLPGCLQKYYSGKFCHFWTRKRQESKHTNHWYVMVLCIKLGVTNFMLEHTLFTFLMVMYDLVRISVGDHGNACHYHS
jgi:hypothetical protein